MIALVVCSTFCGCAALLNPVANGIPVHVLPPELLAEPKDGKVPLPLFYLRQQPPDAYRLGPGDLLAVYVEGVLGEREGAPPVNFPIESNLAPALGYPITVRQDGSISLPLVPPIHVEGRTIEEAEKMVINAYTTGQLPILKAAQARILVSLIRPRQIRVLVMRQDSPERDFTLRRPGILQSTRSIVGGAEYLAGPQKGTGTVVDLPAYENDVLNALARSGGLPGTNAVNEVIVQRGYYQQQFQESLLNGRPVENLSPPGGPTGSVVRIPLRMRPGEPVPFQPEDIVLHTGDIVYIEAREAEVFYTGGLLPSGEFPLPRDYDLDVIEAIATVGGPMVNGAINVNNLNGVLVTPGIGAPSPSLVTVLRRTPDGRQIAIRVDLKEALRDPRASLLVKAGDVLILQETHGEAITRYVIQTLRFDFFGRLVNRRDFTSTATATIP